MVPNKAGLIRDDLANLPFVLAEHPHPDLANGERNGNQYVRIIVWLLSLAQAAGLCRMT
jgi:hypothetical protein